MSVDYSTTFAVDQTQQQALDAIIDVRGWWAGEIEGDTDTLGAEFTYTVPDMHYSRQRITELRPERVSWLVVDSNLSFVEDKHEWTGTTVTFDIVERDGRTEVRFSHVGLVPESECYEGCSSAWTSIVNDSLRSLISTGDGRLVPFTTAEPATD